MVRQTPAGVSHEAWAVHVYAKLPTMQLTAADA